MIGKKLNNNKEDFADLKSRTIRFKNVAREIISKDRSNRRSGYSVDTVGSVARAMEKGFILGQQVALGEIKPAVEKPDHSKDYLEWKTIPIKSRNALNVIFMFGYGLKFIEYPYMKKREWLCIRAGFVDRTYGNQTISILIRLGLLQILVNKEERTTFAGATYKGLVTWKKAMRDGLIFESPFSNIWGIDDSRLDLESEIEAFLEDII